MRRNSFFLLVTSLLLCGAAAPKKAKTVFLQDQEMAKVTLPFGRTTIISFPVKPNKVILGSKGLFAIEYIENDVAIAPLSQNAKSNLFVYLEGRRFAFDLETTTKSSDEIILVRDAMRKKAEGKRKKK